MDFELTSPCDRCPFRSDIPPFLTTDRAEEIVAALLNGATFTCHKTTVPTEEGDEMQDGPNAQHCVGALILLETLEQPNQLMRIAERLGFYDRRKLNLQAPVFTSPQDFIDAQECQADPEADDLEADRIASNRQAEVDLSDRCRRE